MTGNQKPTSCLVVGNYCHDVLMKDDAILGESLGGAAAFISAVMDGVAIPSTFVSKVGPDFAYSVAHPPLVSPSSKTTLFHAHFSSQVQREDRVLKRVRACEPIAPSDLPTSRRFEFGLAVGVGGEILPETLEKMLDICETVLVDVQALIRVFDAGDGTVRLVNLRDSGFYHLIPKIGFLKASSDEAPYIDLAEAKNACCVVVTNGEDGCRVYYRDAEQHIAPFPTVQVDPTGAGDSFLGGLVFGLAQGLTVPDAALLGNFFGSLTVSQLGLPKFDLSLLQAVKNEVQRKRLQLFECRQGLNDELVFSKPLDHDEFHTVLVRAKTLPTSQQECQLELPPGSPRVVENHNNLPCSGQPTLFSG
ncbi:Inositol 3-kinase [Striga hermonthica]|uniref:Inositol 3-kinase n=1 Tax=Striga hermonthica TaxID=68872 RepID=A0A9N7MVG4_STRHE|nr:Inositol 3-kinase [Striga hermonthica]